MEANLCLRTHHLPAMRHHRNIMMHSSVRLPVLQVKAGPPPGASRVAMVGAGVVVACALGAVYWKRGKAMAMVPPSSASTNYGGSGDTYLPEEVTTAVSQDNLPDLLFEICIKASDPKPTRLTKLMDQCLKKDKGKFGKGRGALEKKFNATNDYDLGLVLIVALINEKEYAKAKEICSKLKSIASSPSDSRPDLLSAIVNMMETMESMLKSPSTAGEKLKLVEEAWERYMNNPFSRAPSN